jgi:allantoate deiminase
MDLRRDPMAGFAEIATAVINTAREWGRPAVTTVGRVVVEPNFPAIIPEKVTFMIDVRHSDPQEGKRLYAAHEATIRAVAERRALALRLELLEEQIPTTCDKGLVTAVREAAETLRIETTMLASGGGHDAQEMAKIAKIAMIFVRSKDGRSHTPKEYSTIEDIILGVKVLASTLHSLAY